MAVTRGDWAPAPEPLPAPVVDNHCHLDFEFEGASERSVEDRLAAAAAAGVDRVVQIGCDPASARWTADAVTRFPQMLGGVALHPNDAARLAAAGQYDEAFAEIARLARGERIRVVGETGLDFFRTGPEGRDAQIRAFRDHIALAKELGLALQIHDRDAHEAVLEVLDRDGAPERTVFHCFSGDADFARACLERGAYLSFAGTVTFSNAAALREAAAITPIERILLETDAPFLAPHPHRGAANAPEQVALTARVVATCLDASLDALCEAVSRTSEELYGPW
ncbi:MAG: TatD family hydrolase [Actinomycetes bacterium]